MNHKKFTIALIMTAFLLPLQVHAKGKPDNVVLLKDADGEKIGVVIGMETVSWPYVLTDQGYRALFRVGTGMVYSEAPVYYESTDCTGDAYVGKRSPGTVFLPTLQDELAYSASAILFSPNDAQEVLINTNSMLGYDLNCIPYLSERELFPAYPNDPGITGIENVAYPARMLIE